MQYFILAGIGAAVIMRRNPLNIFRLSFKYPLFVIFCLLIQVLCGLLRHRLGTINNIVLPLSFVGVIIWLVINRSIPGLWLIAVGTALNLAALVTHGGQMPVSEDALRIAGIDISSLGTDNRHFSAFHTTLWWLTDFIPFLGHVFSPGDLFVGAGLIRFVYKNSKAGS